MHNLWTPMHGHTRLADKKYYKMQSTALLPSLSGPLLPGVVAPDKVLSMHQIELFDHLNCVQTTNLNQIVRNRTV